MKKVILIVIILFAIGNQSVNAQKEKRSLSPWYNDKVNVFLGTSGDHGQMSPAASSPFNMMSIGPQTYPHLHAGYEYLAKEFIGFTHTRIEGVGCVGTGGNILVKPILTADIATPLVKKTEKAFPGIYSVAFENGVKAEMSVKHNFGIHQYTFPSSGAGLYIDLSYAFDNRFVAEKHQISGKMISGWVDTQTTCNKGIYRIYFALEIANMEHIKSIEEHKLLVSGKKDAREMNVRVGFSSVSEDYAKAKIESLAAGELSKETAVQWNRLLSRIKVEGEKDREDLFYSLLYRGLQAPFLISEPDGKYAAIDGTIQKSKDFIYNGWAIWDNYREQLPMLSLAYPEKYRFILRSIANLYLHGKNNWATKHEPSPTVRTEHAIVVLLDGYRKGYFIDFNPIKDSLIAEVDRLDYSSPDKALESSYDNWALSEILKITNDTLLSKKYLNKALEYKQYWKKDFADLSKKDIDIMPARGMYQGTVWQYRWFVPFDVKGLKVLTGGEDSFVTQLNQFFDGDNYNHANQPDLQVPGMYNASSQPWKSQKLYRNLLLDIVIQSYFNDNSKGIDSYIGRIYKNEPQAYVRTMDDDSGTMSSWFVMRSIGLSAANVGDPIYYLTAPIFKTVTFQWENKKFFTIEVKNYNKDNFYIKSANLNGKVLERNWLTQGEIQAGGLLILETSTEPNKQWGIKNQWISTVKE
ncbi:glycoside hydrolase domain-containing protein [Flavobacterium xanthum]|uniref:Putative alpha-1,2-mannosidase n=1 Tax=Flavobacterium xanthum TaxID=69322 RepID=A0A1M7KZC2_9FLAO|nr:glycoside hydrolase domain-containing protein [Flavobacterium xanthum]MCL6462663.1 glycoside hydrolase family 92 protein [Flavobacterium micromati]SHM70844.1 Putative alpha-1,2-mannosidase [Flavobacterium xanthum]